MVDDFHEMDVRVVEAPGTLDLDVLAGAILAFFLALVLPRTYQSTSF